MLSCFLIGPMLHASVVSSALTVSLCCNATHFWFSFACVCRSDEAQSHARGALHFLVTEFLDSRTPELTFSEHSISQKDVFWVSE